MSPNKPPLVRRRRSVLALIVGSLVVAATLAGTSSWLPVRAGDSPFGHAVLRSGAEKVPGFPDVRGHWGEPVISRAAGLRLIDGYPDGRFYPDRYITRAEFVRILTTAFGLTPKVSSASGFTDTADHWASPHVNAAWIAGVLVEADYPHRRFEPDRPITRLEMAVQLVRALGKQEEAGKPENLETGRGYRDAADVPASLRGYVGVTTRMGITHGFPDGTFGPQKQATRAEATAMILRALDTQDAAHTAVEFFRCWARLDLEGMAALMRQPLEKFIPDSDIVFAPFYPKKYPDDVPAFVQASRDLIRQYDATAWENIAVEEAHVHPATLPPRATVRLRLGKAPYHIWADMELTDEGWTGWRVRMLDSLPMKSEHEIPPSSYSLERLQPMDVRDLDGTPGAEILGWAFWGEYEGMGPEPSGARGLFSLNKGKLTKLWFTTEGPAPGWVWTGEGIMGHLTSPDSFDLLLVTRPAYLDGKPVSEEGPRLGLYRPGAYHVPSGSCPPPEKVAEVDWPRLVPPGTSVYYGLMAARPLDDIPGDEIVISAFCTPPTGSAYQLVVIARLEGTSLRVLASHKSAAGESLYLTFAPAPQAPAGDGTTPPCRLYVWTWRGQEITALVWRRGEFSFTSLPVAHQAVLAAADVDGDGRDEFLVETPRHRLQLLAQDGSVLWETEAYKSVGQAWMARVGGRLTLVAAEPGADANRVVRWEEVNAPSETGQAQTWPVQTGRARPLALERVWTSPPLGRARISSLWVTDLDGDGDLEIAVTSTSEHLAPADYLHVFDLQAPFSP